MQEGSHSNTESRYLLQNTRLIQSEHKRKDLIDKEASLLQKQTCTCLPAAGPPGRVIPLAQTSLRPGLLELKEAGAAGDVQSKRERRLKSVHLSHHDIMKIIYL